MVLSYAQNMEDIHLAHVLGDQATGFYIDVGGGHVVADNVSFFFYEKGWRGIVVEPQEPLASVYHHVRPRDIVISALAGRAEGVATFFEAEAFHGLSTTVAANADLSAGRGVASRQRSVPVTTLAALCAAYAPAVIDFLKIDVEGAEAEVIAGNDWARFRPRIVVLEAVAPWTMQDVSSSFEPLLRTAGYRFAFFDNLNRFYVAEECAGLAARFPAAPLDWGSVSHLGMFGPADEDATHPDHALARQLPRGQFSALNTLTEPALRRLLPAGTDPASEATRAALARIASPFDGGFVG